MERRSMYDTSKTKWRYFGEKYSFRVSGDGVWAEFYDNGQPTCHADMQDISESFDQRYGGGSFNQNSILEEMMCYGLHKRYPKLFKEKKS